MPQTRLERNAKQKAKYWADPALSRMRDKLKYQRKLKRMAETKAESICFDGCSVQQALSLWGS